MEGGGDEMGSQQALRQAKRSLRKVMAGHLDRLSDSSVGLQSADLALKMLGYEAFQKAAKVSIYVSMEKGEVKTEKLCMEALGMGKRLYVPRFATSKTVSSVAETFQQDMKMLRVYDREDFEAMVGNRWGIREPDEVVKGKRREDALDPSTGGDGLDLILAPGVAFDTGGGRLGHGKGYYDRYITRCEAFQQAKGRSGPVTIALALQEQILAEPERVPSDEHDRRLDNIMTPHGPLLRPSAS